MGDSVHAKSLQSWPTLCDSMEPARLLCPYAFLGKYTEVGCHALPQGSSQSVD